MDQHSFFTGYAFGAGVMAFLCVPRILLDAWWIYELRKRAVSASPEQT